MEADLRKLFNGLHNSTCTCLILSQSMALFRVSGKGWIYFSKIDRSLPIIVEAVWQYSHHILAGLISHGGTDSYFG